MRWMPAAILLLAAVCSASAQERHRFILPGQHCLEVRDPSQLCSAALPDSPSPPTIDQPLAKTGHRLTLEEAISIAVQNSQVVRILAGDVAISSGQTIYDPAVANTTIDENRADFDPTVEVNNSFDRVEVPDGQLSNIGVQNTGLRSDGYNLTAGVSKKTALGGTAGFRVDVDRRRLQPAVFPLNPFAATATEFSYVQPLLQGAGWRVNRVPIVVARIQTEQSFFRLKGAMQRMVADVVQVYWSLVAARLDRDVRARQVQYAADVYELAEERMKADESDADDVTQSATTLALLEADLVNAESSVIQQEAALRNLMGVPPAGYYDTFIPVTAPLDKRIQFDWEEMLVLAELYRPDVVELKLVLEADEQLRIQANNQARPRVDAVALYRWNGLEGTTMAGSRFSTDPESFQDWTLGVNFSVPIGLRRERAALRRQQLLISRDRENIKQSIHSASHLIAQSFRRQAQSYRQYDRFHTARLAAEENLGLLEARFEEEEGQRSDVLLRLLQTIQDWGTAVRGEALALAGYNSELARLELETGTILESHAIRFIEEQRAFIGPFGRLGRGRCFVSRLPAVSDLPAGAPAAAEPAEQFFQVKQAAEKIDAGPSKPAANRPDTRAKVAPNRRSATRPKALPPRESGMPSI